MRMNFWRNSEWFLIHYDFRRQSHLRNNLGAASANVLPLTSFCPISANSLSFWDELNWDESNWPRRSCLTFAGKINKLVDLLFQFCTAIMCLHVSESIFNEGKMILLTKLGDTVDVIAVIEWMGKSGIANYG